MNRSARMSFSLFLVLACFLFAAFSLASGQITDVNDTTSTPVEGAGHDYIKALSETVNPANGSVSVRIQAPVAKGRGLTIPFSFGYDSNGFRHLKPGIYPNYGTVNWASNTGYTGQGGWVLSIPQLSFDSWIGTAQVLTGYSGGQPVYQNYYCDYATGYTLRDGSGAVHALGLGTRVSEQNYTPQYCLYASVPSSGDPQVRASLTTLAYGQTTGDLYLIAPVKVYTADGTLYYFSSLPGVSGSGATQYALPTYIEDRNGNRITISGGTFTDTLGRTLFSGSLGSAGQTKTVSVSGINYQVTWRSVAASYSVTQQWAGPAGGPGGDAGCFPIPAVNDTQTVVSTITLPNGQAYNFYYGNDVTPHNATTNSYGLLSEIDYPSGGWVQYRWKPSDTMNELANYPGLISSGCVNQYPCFNPAPAQNACVYQYKTPVVSSRIESFGGSTPSLTQTFTYATTWDAPVGGNTLGITWSSKSTNVTTTDSVLGKSYLTKYAYGYAVAPPVPFSNATLPNQIPVESSTRYYDWGNTTSPIRTVTKTWYDQYDLASEAITEGGKTSTTTYCYVGINCVPASNNFAQLQEKDDYDFGTAPPSSPTRKTATTYQSFSGTPGIIANAPCKTIVSDGSNNPAAETDYYYDGGTQLCGPLSSVQPTAYSATVISGTHDDVGFGSNSTVPRGNVTTKVRWANAGTSPATTYAYDTTGRVRSIKDPCGNVTCADMTGSTHTTTFSYTDAFTVLSGGVNNTYNPTGGATNAYLTQITDPLGHVSSFTYDYYSGELTKSTDPNSRSATYLYNDAFARPTQVDYPDGGQTTIAYNDSPYSPSTPSPSITSTTVIVSGTNKVSTVALDGMEHTTDSILSSDPVGADHTNAIYCGTGKVCQASNPHRSGSSSTDGTTTSTYDGLGRTIAVVKPDSSVVSTKYDLTSSNTNSICTMVTDEAGNSRQSCSDGLGRLIEVAEPGTGASPGGVGRGTVTIGGTEQTRPASSGTASVSVSGSGRCTWNGYTYVPDSGTVSVTVYGVQTATSSSSWGGSCNGSTFNGSTPSSIASNLASSLSSSAAGVTATAQSATITIRARATGSGTNYQLSYGRSGSTDFTVSGPSALTGGANSLSDFGTVSLTVGGFPVSYSYSAVDTATSIASALASRFNDPSSPVTAQTSGSTITLTANQGGPNSNYSLSGSTTWDTAHFTNPSFNMSDSGSTLTGGTDGTLGTSPLVTLYTYDLLGNLLTVNQKGADPTSANWRTRTFSYDSLSRLLTAYNPESGTTIYTYDANGNVSTKTDARNVSVTYGYDVLNRVTSKAFSNGDSNIAYTYDAFVNDTSCGGTGNFGIGRRTGMTDGSGSTTWTYDTMGRVWQETHTIGGVTKTFTNCYNLDGSVKQTTYPAGSGTVLAYTYDAAAHLTQLKDTAHNITYFQNPSYFPGGQLNQATYGSVIETSIYNSRLQPCWYYATTGTALSPSTPCSGTATAANVLDLKYNFGFGLNDNGNVLSLTNDKDSNRSVAYTYDMLNRIVSATTPNSDCTILPSGITRNWGESFTIDPWGNLSQRNVTKCSAEPLSVAPLPNNRLSELGYDASGNVTSNGGANYTYDAESRLKTAGGVTYTYDGDGNRVKKSSGTEYWGTGPIIESDGSGNFQREFIFAGGKRIARRDIATGNVYYYLTDMLGSSDVVTNASGAIQNESDYYPYGGERVYSQVLTNQNYKFTGKERDAESGLDNFGARYDASSLGRFMTPDPLLNSGRPWDPQTWNRYAYAHNNPLSYVDPSGLYDWQASAGGSATDDELRKKSQNRDLSRKERNAAKNALKFRDKFRSALAAATGAAAGTGDQGALAAYGTEGDHNGVNVGTQLGYGAGTILNKDDTTSVNFGKELSGNDLAVTVAHEGQHVEDGQAWVAAGHPALGSLLDMNHYERETRAWGVSARIAQALGMSHFGPHGGGSDYYVWNSSWHNVDRVNAATGKIVHDLYHQSPGDTDRYSRENLPPVGLEFFDRH